MPTYELAAPVFGKIWGFIISNLFVEIISCWSWEIFEYFLVYKPGTWV